jgi:predicted aspartyl protease
MKRAMGTFYVRGKIENPVDRTRSAVIPKLLVDTGSEYTWVSAGILERIGVPREKKDLAFVLANGQEVTRSVGFAIIRLDKFFTVDEVVFAEKGDLLLLGARTLEGLNLRPDPRRKKLVAAGPLPAAAGWPGSNGRPLASVAVHAPEPHRGRAAEIQQPQRPHLQNRAHHSVLLPAAR